MAWGQDGEASAFTWTEKLTTADPLPLEWWKCARKQITISSLEWLNIFHHVEHRGDVGTRFPDSSNTLGCYNKPLSFFLIHLLGPHCSLGGSQKGEKMKNELLKFKASSHFSSYVWKTIFLIVEWMGAAAWGGDLMSVSKCFRTRLKKQKNNQQRILVSDIFTQRKN